MSNMPQMINPGQGFRGFNVPQQGSAPASPPQYDAAQAKQMEQMRQRQVRLERGLVQRQQRLQKEMRDAQLQLHRELVNENHQNARKFYNRQQEIRRQARATESDLAKSNALFEAQKSLLEGDEAGKPGMLLANIQEGITGYAEQREGVFERIGTAVSEAWTATDNKLQMGDIIRTDQYGPYGDGSTRSDEEELRRLGVDVGEGRLSPDEAREALLVHHLQEKLVEAIAESHDPERREQIKGGVRELVRGLYETTRTKRKTGLFSSENPEAVEERRRQKLSSVGAAIETLRGQGVSDVELSAITQSFSELGEQLLTQRKAQIAQSSGEGESVLSAEQIEEVMQDRNLMRLQEMGSWMQRLPDVTGNEKFRFSYTDKQQIQEARNTIPDLIVELAQGGFGQSTIENGIGPLPPDLQEIVLERFRHSMRQAENRVESTVGYDIEEEELLQSIVETQATKNEASQRIHTLTEDLGDTFLNAAQGRENIAVEAQRRASEAMEQVRAGEEFEPEGGDASGPASFWDDADFFEEDEG